MKISGNIINVWEIYIEIVRLVLSGYDWMRMKKGLDLTVNKS